MEFSLNFYLIAIVAVIISGIAKSGFIGGGGIMAVPLMSLTIDPQVAAGIMLPILCALDAINSWKYRQNVSYGLLKILVPGALLGILIGSLTWRYLDASALRLGIGILALFFVVQKLFKFSRKSVLTPMGPKTGVGLGTISGFTSFIAHAGGPPSEAFLLSQAIDKSKLVATNIYYYFIVNFVKLIPYFLLGQLSTSNLKVSLQLAPMIPVGILIGYSLHRIVSQEMFMKISYTLLGLTGLKLLWDGVTGLL